MVGEGRVDGLHALEIDVKKGTEWNRNRYCSAELSIVTYLMCILTPESPLATCV